MNVPPLFVKKNQRGSTLLVSLLLLLMLTLLALSSTRTASLQQRMSSNLQQKHFAFHAAENGIAVAVLRLEGNKESWPTDNPKSLCSNASMFANWGDTCAADEEHYYQVRVTPTLCPSLKSGGENNNVCFSIFSKGVHGDQRTVHQQGYLFPRTELPESAR